MKYALPRCHTSPNGSSPGYKTDEDATASDPGAYDRSEATVRIIVPAEVQAFHADHGGSDLLNVQPMLQRELLGCAGTDEQGGNPDAIGHRVPLHAAPRQGPTCSLTFSRRAAPATESSPAITLNTIRSSPDRTLGQHCPAGSEERSLVERVVELHRRRLAGDEPASDQWDTTRQRSKARTP